jgi:hypothetical protein
MITKTEILSTLANDPDMAYEVLRGLLGISGMMTLERAKHPAVRREAKDHKEEAYSCGYCGGPNPPAPPSEVYGPGAEGYPICPDCHGC